MIYDRPGSYFLAYLLKLQITNACFLHRTSHKLNYSSPLFWHKNFIDWTKAHKSYLALFPDIPASRAFD